MVDTLMGELEALSPCRRTMGSEGDRDAGEHRAPFEEEEGEMFEKARQVFDAGELKELGERMADRKAAMEGQMTSQVR